jgi:hypothetical protein
MSFRDKDKLSDNWRFSEQRMPVKVDTLKGYIDEYGEERAKGYLEAIADVQAEIAWMLSSIKRDSGGFARSASKMQTMLNEFKKHKKELVDHAINQRIVNSDEALFLKLIQK